MFTFHYRLSEEDYVLFNKHYLLTSPHGKSSVFGFRFSFPLVCLAMLFVFMIAKIDRLFLMILIVVFFVISVLWIVFSKNIMLKMLESNIEKMKNRGRLPYMEEGTLTFDETGISDIGPVQETKTFYTAVEKIEVAETAVYIYYSSAQAFLIPLRCFSDPGQKNDFLTFLRSKATNASAK